MKNPHSVHGRWRRVAPWLGGAALAATAWTGRTAIPELERILVGDSLITVSAGLALLALANVSGALMFSAIAGATGGRHLIAVYLTSQIAKYIPGRFWTVALQVALVRQLSGAELVVVNLRAAAGVSIATASVGFALLAYASSHAMLALTTAIAGWLAASAFASAGATDVVRSAARRFITSSRIRRALDATTPTGGHDGLIAMSLAVFTCLYAAGWCMVVRGVLPSDNAFRVVGVLSLSYLVGAVSLLPAGIGAREAAMMFFAPLAGAQHSDMAMLAIVSRAGLLILDVGLAALGWVLLKWPNPCAR